MKSKFFIISVLLHIIVFIVFSQIFVNSLKNGENSPNINVNLTMSAPGNSNKTLAKMTTEKEKSADKNTKQIKKKINPKKENIPKKQVVQKKIIKAEPKIVQSKKTKPEKIIKPMDPGYTESDKNSEIEAVQKTAADDAVLGNQENDKNLIKIQNGQYALKNQKVSGINIVIHKEIPPSYPDLALKMGYEKETLVKVKFLVDKKGRVEDIKFYTSSKYGFEDEVKKALKQWVFEPVVYQDKPMPIYFYKVFHFVSKS
ncbi:MULTISPECIES: energy transducer TonB [Psychrilyobacter]|uniref:TonB family protein n=1 Tax=Psychrilyobacter piezotolerans TaxID=2293438 RepID=A0ABX9KKP3_9FUSO|nr:MULTISPECIES: energy transducer TonB [Psychrilyobacter]MCS5421858.1 energy transducer TonB [Psychrilyobacter sp. S5]NDI76749.1 energy transducer TonB [Psychrilyobacter piezotolerans]RDE65367.1 energy transducer TonB [Psychrilyobacter sp. S5]REI42985.1 TonB family protein [Psychrilyobacter piezotolerans]